MKSRNNKRRWYRNNERKRPQTSKMIEQKAQDLHSDIFSVSNDYSVQNVRVSLGKTTFNFTGFGCELRELELRMTGEYQADNAGLHLQQYLH